MIEVERIVCGNYYFHRMLRTSADGRNCIDTHRHTYDHILECLEGRLLVVSEGLGMFEMRKGDMTEIPAGRFHGIEFLEDGTVARCMHTLRDEEGHEVPFCFEKSNEKIQELTEHLIKERMPGTPVEALPK